jgi:DNA-directed RNA polymerase specialized sigma24 family protein
MDFVDARSACVTLNAMSMDHRQAFFRVIVEGMPLERLAQESGKPLDAVQELLRQVGVAVHGRVAKRQHARRRNWL